MFDHFWRYYYYYYYCFFSSLLLTPIWTENHIEFETEFVFEKVLSPNETESFIKCHYHMLGRIYICWRDSAIQYHIEEEDILNRWPSDASGCCAVWMARACWDVKLDTYPACKVSEVTDYYNQMEQAYKDNGCQAYTPDKYNCNNYAHPIPKTRKQFILFISVIAMLIIHFNTCWWN